MASRPGTNLFCALFTILFVTACSDSSTAASSNSTDPGQNTAETNATSTDTTNPGGTNTDESIETIQPNILIVISDDQGLDASAQYNLGNDVPNTPVVNQLAANGITFDNMWATPSCTTTRASILSGYHGIHNGVTGTPGLLSANVGALPALLKSRESSANYVTGVFGKWHVAGGNPDFNHPAELGVDHYAGNLTGNIGDYTNWERTVNGETATSTTYHTTAIVDDAIDWIATQSSPWLTWVAFSAPHSPFHVPPQGFNTRNLSAFPDDIDNNRREYFLAAIETLDTELGRLLDNIPDDELEQTLIIYMGDNGSPRTVIDLNAYIMASHGKGSLFEGGIRVPMVVSGFGVSRANERESGLANTVDILPTVLEMASGETFTARDGVSLVPGFTSPAEMTRELNYSEFLSDVALGSGWTVRSLEYKYLSYTDGSEALYNLTRDLDEAVNLLPGAAEQRAIADELKSHGLALRGESTQSTLSTNTSPVDITNALLTNTSKSCLDYVNEYTAMATDANLGTTYTASFEINSNNTHCSFRSNAIPNHRFNDGTNTFPNPVSEQTLEFQVALNPQFANSNTALRLDYDDAIFLNGVKLDLLAAGCFGVGNGRIGCNNVSQPWRFDPMFEANGFRVDTHNAHTQPNGEYHYHGNPNALFAQNTDSASPVVGFAADGFPIFGSYFSDNGAIRKALSSYQLKSGVRPAGTGNPGGQYDGSFRDDYEYRAGTGDLDECNGMSIDGAYGYYITDSYPHVLACFKGNVDPSFAK